MDENRITELVADMKDVKKELNACVTQVMAVSSEVHAFSEIVRDIRVDNKESHARFWNSHEADMANVRRDVEEKLKTVEEKIKNGDKGVQIWALIALVGFLVNLVLILWKR